MKKIKKIISKSGLKREHLSKNLLILMSLFLLSTLIVMLFSIFVVQSVLTSSYLSIKERQDRYDHWMGQVEEYPNSPDVLYNAAVSAVEVKKNETALNLLNKALIYDPLFEEAKDLQQEIIKGVN